MKAPRADQLALIEIADLDAQIARLESQNKKHPLREELGVLIQVIAAKSLERTQNQERLDEARALLTEREDATAAANDELQRKQAAYNSGEGLTSKGLVALEGEIKASQAKVDQVSEDEFEALEDVDYREQREHSLAEEISELNDAMLKKRAELEEVVADIEAEANTIRAQRDAKIAAIHPELAAAYEHARRSGGYAVITMAPNGSTSAGLSLSPIEVAQVKNGADDEVYISEEHDAIIVRVD